MFSIYYIVIIVIITITIIISISIIIVLIIIVIVITDIMQNAARALSVDAKRRSGAQRRCEPPSRVDVWAPRRRESTP